MLITLLITAAIIIAILILRRKSTANDISVIQATDALNLIKNKECLILDVRSAQEYQSGHLRDSKLIPLNELSSRLNDIDSYKDKPLLVYCHSGGRSTAASQILLKNGFSKVNNLQGGINAWINSGNEIER